MEKNNILTIFRKFGFGIVIFGALLLLAGCGDFSPIDASSTGFFNQFIVYPFSLLIKAIAGLFQGSYGLSIIVITLTIRFVILPFMVKQQKQSQDAQKKMAVIKPKMDEIQKKFKDKRSMDDQMEMQRELSALYKKHDFHPGKMAAGCLPLIIQMPVLIGFYYAIRRTPEIAEASFLWFNLGETDLLLVLLAALIYYIQARVSLIGMDQSQQGPMALIAYISPIMIGVVSLTMPAALPLYWVVSGLFMVIQTFIIKKYEIGRAHV